METTTNRLTFLNLQIHAIMRWNQDDVICDTNTVGRRVRL